MNVERFKDIIVNEQKRKKNKTTMSRFERKTGVENDDEDEQRNVVDVIVSSESSESSSEDESDDNEEEATMMMMIRSRPPKSAPKWYVSVQPRLVTSNHSWTGLGRASSRTNLSAKSSGCASSTTSLVKKVLSSQDLEINVSQDKLNEFHGIIMATFERRQKVFKSFFFFLCLLIFSEENRGK